MDTRVYHKIALTLADNHQVRIFNTFPSPHTILTNPSFEQVPKARKCILLRSFYYKVKDYKPDVVICVEPMTLFAGIKLKRKLSCKLVYDCHEFFAMASAEKFRNPIVNKLVYACYYTIENILLKFVDSSIAVNEYLGARLAEVCDDVHVCANNPVASINKRSENEVKKKYDFIYAGGISFERGLKVVLEACKNLLEEREIKFLFLGRFVTQSARDYFEDFVESNGFKRKIIHFNKIPHDRVFHYLEQSRIGMMVTNPEIPRYRLTLSLKVLEYLEAGLPVIVNDYPIMKRRIIKAGTGMLSGYSPEALKKVMLKCLELADDKTEYKKISSKAVDQYKKHFTWESQISELEEAVKLNTEKRVLLFAYFFPPLGGPGVQRPCKMVKYFKNSGILTDVITVKNIQFHSYDDSMSEECRADSTLRTFTADPMGILYILRKLSKQKTNKLYFQTGEKKKKLIRALFPIDEKILWLPFALYSGIKAVLQKKHDYVMATIGPYTSGVAAYFTSIITGKPLIIDYRDHWTINRYLFYATSVHKQISESMERNILKRAKIITVVSNTMKEELITKFGSHLRKKISVMYNGWDANDFKEEVERDDDKLVFSYVGNFYGNRSPEFLVNALKELKAEDKLPENILFRFVGNFFIEWMNMLSCPELNGVIEILPQVNHKEAVGIMQKSDVLILFIATASGKNVLTGKIFEYLRTGKEILAMVPRQGDAEKLLKTENYNHICTMEDVKEIKKQILMLIKNNRESMKVHKVNPEYSRENQVMKLSDRIRAGE